MAYRLLIIDPQADFHPKDDVKNPNGGQLAVAGAIEDSEKIAALLTEAPPAEIYVSLDTHTVNHIGHTGFWTPTPAPFTFFKVEDDKIMGGSFPTIILGTGGEKKEYTPKNRPELLEWAKFYINTLPTTGRGIPLIWPTHCLENEPGHDVLPLLKAALDAAGVPVEYHIKGQNEASEMYSIFKAELPVEDHKDKVVQDLYTGTNKTSKATSKINASGSDKPDGAYLATNFNQGLFASLTKDNAPIVVCGEALSHCVNWSTRDLHTMIKEMEKTNTVVVLFDASSPVGTFEQNVLDLFTYCFTNGIRLMTKDQFVAFIKNPAADIKETNNSELKAMITKLGGDPARILRAPDGVWPGANINAGRGGYRKRHTRRASKKTRSRKTRGRKH
jgi:nicotinamidase-related amidase